MKFTLAAAAFFAMFALGNQSAFAKKPPKPRPVPELDAGTAGAALALLGGGAAVLLERRRRRARTDAE